MASLSTGASDWESGSAAASSKLSGLDPPLDPNRMIGEIEAAALRNVSVDTLRRMAKAGKVKRYRVGAKRIAYSYAEIIDPPEAE
jgi:hypothetical protein